MAEVSAEATGIQAKGNLPIRHAILIAGPTASGKSALAARLAQSVGGVVVNADSMQVYGVLDVLTARPGAAERHLAPHRLYGYVDPSVPYSAGRWLADVEALAEAGEFVTRRPIFVGGTGLYFEALSGGLAEMPEIDPARRRAWRTRLASEGPVKLHDVLAKRDPRAAAALEPGDSQRIVRALEIVEASGRSILDWQASARPPLVDEATATKIVIDADRAVLVTRIDRRFEAMVESGAAAAEAAALAALALDRELPAMKAIGVREMQSVIEGSLTFEEGKERAKIATRQYAKRQATWFRHRFSSSWRRITLSDDTSIEERVTEFAAFDNEHGRNGVRV